MFNVQLLRTLVVHAAFLCLHFRFVLYWHKTVGTKAARRTLVKLTPGCLCSSNMNNPFAQKKILIYCSNVGWLACLEIYTFQSRNFICYVLMPLLHRTCNKINLHSIEKCKRRFTLAQKKLYENVISVVLLSLSTWIKCNQMVTVSKDVFEYLCSSFKPPSQYLSALWFAYVPKSLNDQESSSDSASCKIQPRIDPLSIKILVHKSTNPGYSNKLKRLLVMTVWLYECDCMK